MPQWWNQLTLERHTQGYTHTCAWLCVRVCLTNNRSALKGLQITSKTQLQSGRMWAKVPKKEKKKRNCIFYLYTAPYWPQWGTAAGELRKKFYWNGLPGTFVFDATTTLCPWPNSPESNDILSAACVKSLINIWAKRSGSRAAGSHRHGHCVQVRSRSLDTCYSLPNCGLWLQLLMCCVCQARSKPFSIFMCAQTVKKLQNSKRGKREREGSRERWKER